MATIAGVAYISDTKIFEIDDSEFFDIEIPASWVPPDSTPDAIKVRGPENVWAWVDVEGHHVWLPELPLVVRGWQLRQITPAISASFDRLVIHASASVINGQAVAFVGESGAGKSTIAWEFLKAGHTLLADDLLPIRFDPTPVVPTSSGPLPLAAVCFLSRGSEDLAITEVDKVTALNLQVTNGFGEHQVPTISAFQFDGYHRIADTVPHFDLMIPDDRGRLPDIVTRTATFLGSLTEDIAT